MNNLDNTPTQNISKTMTMILNSFYIKKHLTRPISRSC